MSNLIDNPLNNPEIQTKLYDDLVHPTMEGSGKLLSLIPQTINAALVPWRKWILGKEHDFNMTAIIAKKLEKIAEENIITPEPYIAVPALQALSYAMDSEELRDLYANLIAKAMVKDTKGFAHPSFVEIIKQMSPNDAAYFKMLASLKSRHIADIYGIPIGEDDFSFKFVIIKERVNFFSKGYTDEEVSIIMNNLTRLGLIRTTDDGTTITYSDDDNKDFEQKVGQIYNISKYSEYKEIRINHKTILITDFGELFNKICVQD